MIFVTLAATQMLYPHVNGNRTSQGCHFSYQLTVPKGIVCPTRPSSPRSFPRRGNVGRDGDDV